MTRFQLTREQRALRDHLRAYVAAYEADPDLVYRGPGDFVLRHGHWYDGRPLRRDVDPGAPSACYGNAIVYAVVRGWRYVEGFAYQPGDEPRQHAWLLDERGLLVDPTWPLASPWTAYLGVVFSVERADDATWNGDATVLDDFNRGWPLLREPWAGEDASLEWPLSPRLEAIRDLRDSGSRFSIAADPTKEGAG